MPDSVKPYKRKATPLERLFTRSPFSIVALVARIRGRVSESTLRAAVLKVQQRHANLRARIVDDEGHAPWFTSEGAGELQVQVVPRASGSHWMQVIQEQSRVPFAFDARPPVRFLLLQSPDLSELVILCHHILCDGLSLAYLARDLMAHLGDPARPVEVLPGPAPINLDNWPPGVTLNGIARFFIERINKKWAAEKVLFDQQDYLDLSAAYWARVHHRMLSVELSEAQTTALVERCRAEQVTVNSALTAAFVGAQCRVQGPQRCHASIGVAASLRDRLPRPAGEAMGFFAGIVTLQGRYALQKDFWDNARRLHNKLKPRFTDKNLFQDPLAWCYLDPTILEALNFKRLGALVAPDAPRHAKLAAFGKRDDVVLGVLKREKMERLDQIAMGTAVTNLTRMDFPRQYGALELDRLMMHPGGAFPLSNVNLVLGAVTCAGKLSLVLEYAEEAVETRAMEEIRAQALEFLGV